MLCRRRALGAAIIPRRTRRLPWNDGAAADLPSPFVASEVAQPARTTAEPGLCLGRFAAVAHRALPSAEEPARPRSLLHQPRSQLVCRLRRHLEGCSRSGFEIGNQTSHHCRAAQLPVLALPAWLAPTPSSMTPTIRPTRSWTAGSPDGRLSVRRYGLQGGSGGVTTWRWTRSG